MKFVGELLLTAEGFMILMDSINDVSFEGILSYVERGNVYIWAILRFYHLYNYNEVNSNYYYQRIYLSTIVKEKSKQIICNYDEI